VIEIISPDYYNYYHNYYNYAQVTDLIGNNAIRSYRFTDIVSSKTKKKKKGNNVTMNVTTLNLPIFFTV